MMLAANRPHGPAYTYCFNRSGIARESVSNTSRPTPLFYTSFSRSLHVYA